MLAKNNQRWIETTSRRIVKILWKVTQAAELIIWKLIARPSVIIKNANQSEQRGSVKRYNIF